MLTDVGCGYLAWARLLVVQEVRYVGFTDFSVAMYPLAQNSFGNVSLYCGNCSRLEACLHECFAHVEQTCFGRTGPAWGMPKLAESRLSTNTHPRGSSPWTACPATIRRSNAPLGRRRPLWGEQMARLL